jgi:hypothetical protein
LSVDSAARNGSTELGGAARRPARAAPSRFRESLGPIVAELSARASETVRPEHGRYEAVADTLLSGVRADDVVAPTPVGRYESRALDLLSGVPETRVPSGAQTPGPLLLGGRLLLLVLAVALVVLLTAVWTVWIRR